MNCRKLTISSVVMILGLALFAVGKAEDVSSLNAGANSGFDYSAVDRSGQIPLCMIGDSITWAQKGDYWRKELLARLPNLAFIGTHTAMFGYSHAGEGGNSTRQVLARMDDIPDSPYYNLLIGTNNNNVHEEGLIEEKSRQTAAEIIQIVHALLKKRGVKKVFLCSILPCATDNPLRDDCNGATNKILRERFADEFPAERVVWVEYETPIRQQNGWEKIIHLHPNEQGYALLGEIAAQALCSALKFQPGTKPVRPVNTGVRVVNLMGDDGCTVNPVIAGWYVLSCKVDGVTAANPKIILKSRSPGEKSFEQSIPVQAAPGETISALVFTKYEGYGYTRDFMTLTANGCRVSDVLFEKMRPSQRPSRYEKGSYIDVVTPVSPGELLEAGR